VQALAPERPMDDRISAAMALKQSDVVDAELKAVLVERMRDNEELWEVRRMSAEALERFKLDSSEYEAYQAFLSQQQRVSQGGE